VNATKTCKVKWQLPIVTAEIITSLVETRCVGWRLANRKCGDSARSTRAEKVRQWRYSALSHRSAIVKLCLPLTA